ncbi:hypothetical protein D3C71_1777170 [compost metagenome]
MLHLPAQNCLIQIHSYIISGMMVQLACQAHDQHSAVLLHLHMGIHNRHSPLRCFGSGYQAPSRHLSDNDFYAAAGDSCLPTKLEETSQVSTRMKDNIRNEQPGFPILPV